MKKNHSILLMIFVFLVCILFSLPTTSFAARISSAFPKTGDSALDSANQELFAYVLNYAMDEYKTESMKEAFGNAYIKETYYYRDETQFYVKIRYDFSDTPGDGIVTGNKTLTYYFEIKEDWKVKGTGKPVPSFSEHDWILINKYSELDCYKAAEEYFYNQRWNDPSSITVYNYSVEYGAGTYIYYFDYSGLNKLGGRSRDIFVVEVDAATNQVIWGASSGN